MEYSEEQDEMEPQQSLPENNRVFQWRALYVCLCLILIVNILIVICWLSAARFSLDAVQRLLRGEWVVDYEAAGVV